MDPNRRRELLRDARFGRKSPVQSTEGVAVSSHPIVSAIAVDVLREGGNAVDAALAAVAAQVVVEPHMTTPTGYFYLLHRDGTTGATRFLDAGLNRPRRLERYDAAAETTGAGAVVPGWWAGVEAAARELG